MSRAHASRKPGPAHDGARRAGETPTGRRPLAVPAAAVVAALVVVTLIVQRHTLRAFFALDDLVMFQQAAGVRPWPVSPWRWLSGGVWFRAVVPMWGHEPFPYHAVSLLVHVVNVLLLHRLARRWGASPVAAFVGAALFGLSRLHFPALLAATSIGELLALSLTLVALLVVAPGMRMMAAVAAFVLALSAKESALLVPFAAVLVCVTGDSVRARTRALAPLLVAGFAFGALLLWNGIGSGRLGGEAYAVSFGANLFENIARLFGWSIDVLDPIPDLHATTTGAAHVVLPLLALVLTALASRARPGGLLRAGVAWWWLAILPVLPLPGRTYLHYLYVPLAGAALAVAALWDVALRWRAARTRSATTPGRAAWGTALAVVLVSALGSDVLLSMRQDLRMENVDWPLDPVLRKSEIARRAIGDVRSALAGKSARVLILIPAAISSDVDLGSGRIAAGKPITRYALEAVLDDGRSLRAQVANAESVVFVHDYEPGHHGWLCFLSRSDSHLVPLGEVPDAHARYIEAMLASGLSAAALDYATKALANRPDDTTLRALHEQAVLAVGLARQARTTDRGRGR